jgi:hypothetical protein
MHFARFRRLAKDDERLPEAVAELRFLAFPLAAPSPRNSRGAKSAPELRFHSSIRHDMRIVVMASSGDWCVTEPT